MAERNVVLDAVKVSKFYSLDQGWWARLMRRQGRVVHAVDQVNLRIYEGEVVGLVGESGCGKTTLGKLLCRLVEPSSGQVFLQGKDLLKLSKSALRKLRVRFQMLFQNPYSTLNPKMNVYHTLKETLDVNFKLSLPQKNERIQEVLELIGLPHKKNSFPTELSGGERRRVGLARLLLLQPSLIVADEPVAGLDASIKARIVDLMMETRPPHMGYLFISHDLHVIRYVSDRVLVMFLGKIVEDLPVATFDELQHHPYTETLLKAAKQVTIHQGADSEGIDFEDLPSHSEIVGAGCPYAGRCPWIGQRVERQRCLNEEPVLHRVDHEHHIACHFFEQG